MIKNLRLRYELKRAGAGKAEARELARLSARLGGGAAPAFGREQKAALARELGLRRPPVVGLRPALAAACLAVVVGVGLAGHSARPGSALYGIRQVEDYVSGQAAPVQADPGESPQPKAATQTPPPAPAPGSEPTQRSEPTQPQAVAPQPAESAAQPPNMTAPAVGNSAPPNLLQPVTNLLPSVNLQLGAPPQSPSPSGAAPTDDSQGLRLQVQTPLLHNLLHSLL